MKPSRGAGDKGKTSLLGGGRVSKDHARVEACGNVDELNCVVGALVAHLPKTHAELIEEVQGIQSDLTHAGSLLATASVSKIKSSSVGVIEKRRIFLEQRADHLDENLPALPGFILPGGHASAAWAHVARTVCRRAERRVVRLLDSEGGAGADGVPAGSGQVAGGSDRVKQVAQSQADGCQTDEALRKVAVYLNRLSDYLFALARRCNQLTGVQDVPWNE
jgi:cob(I)alamin adenosyltransferase